MVSYTLDKKIYVATTHLSCIDYLSSSNVVSSRYYSYDLHVVHPSSPKFLPATLFHEVVFPACSKTY